MKKDVEAAPGEVGEVWLRGPGIMKRYCGDRGMHPRVALPLRLTMMISVEATEKVKIYVSTTIATPTIRSRH